MIRIIIRGENRLIDETEYAFVTYLFTTINDNRTSVIAKKTKLKPWTVDVMIDHYISTLKIGFKGHEFD